MTVAKGMKVKLFAAEEQVSRTGQSRADGLRHQGPLVGGRLGKLSALEAQGGDERQAADSGRHRRRRPRRQVHHVRRSICTIRPASSFGNGGVLVAMAPDLLFIKDTDGDDKADSRERVLSGLDSADTHHTSNSFTLDPGGALYFQEGTFHHSQVETPCAPIAATGQCRRVSLRAARAEVRRLRVVRLRQPARPRLRLLGAGHRGRRHRRRIPITRALFSGHVDFPAQAPCAAAWSTSRARGPVRASSILSSRHFPDEMQGNLLVGNVIGFQGILQYKVFDKGASFAATEVEPILSSSDPNFRPADLEIGPDGALYFTDWHNPIIGHMQHNLRDPSRDRTHGRVYRVTYEGRPLLKPAKIAGEPIEQAAGIAQGARRPRPLPREDRTERSRQPTKSLPAVAAWVKQLDTKDPRYEHHLLEALWVHQHHNVVNMALLDRVLARLGFPCSGRGRARVVLLARPRFRLRWTRFKKLAADEHPRVRLEAVCAASFFTVPEAVEVAVIAAEQPRDEYLDYVRGETLKTLEPYWKKALAAGQDDRLDHRRPARATCCAHIGNEQLLKLPAQPRGLPRNAPAGRACSTTTAARPSQASPSSTRQEVRARRHHRDRPLAGRVSRTRSIPAWSSTWCAS